MSSANYNAGIVSDWLTIYNTLLYVENSRRVSLREVGWDALSGPAFGGCSVASVSRCGSVTPFGRMSAAWHHQKK